MNQKGINTSKIPLPLVCLALALGLSAPASAAESHPGTEAGATSLLKEFVKPGADHAALSKQLRPAAADYAVVFEADVSSKVAAIYDPAWDAGQMVVAPKPGQSEVKVFSATSDEMKSWAGKAAEFPGGWKDVAPKLKPGLKIYRFKFVEPGKDLGWRSTG